MDIFDFFFQTRLLFEPNNILSIQLLLTECLEVVEKSVTLKRGILSDFFGGGKAMWNMSQRTMV